MTGPQFTKKVQGWYVQMSWSETRPNPRGDGGTITAHYASEGVIVQGLKDWAINEARSRMDHLIASKPDGTVFDIQVHGQRQDITIGEYSEEITGLERQPESFTLEARMTVADYQAPTAADVRKALGGGTELVPSPPDTKEPAA